MGLIENSTLRPEKLGTYYVKTELDQPILLGTLWERNPAIMIFLRHFACITCRAHAVEVWGRRKELENNGAKIYFIGSGAPYFVGKFKKELELFDTQIFTDPTLRVFQAAGFERGFFKALHPSGIYNGYQKSKEGHSQGKYEKDAGDLWQLGGVIMIKPGNKLAYHYISEVAGDYPPEKDIAGI